MALSGNYSNSYSGYTVETKWSAEQSIENNYTDLTVELYLSISSPYSLYIGSRTHTININGSNYSIESDSINSSSGSIYLGSVNKRIYHENDGTLEVYLETTFDMRATINGSYVNSISGGFDTITIDKIPRMSTISDNMIGTRELGTPHTIHINKNLTGNITHTIWYVIRGDKGSSYWHYIAKNTNKLDITFTPTDRNIDLQPNSSTIFMDIGIDTYKDGVKLGETTYNTGWYMKVPDSYSAIINSVDISDINPKTKKLGVYVQNHSKLKISTNAIGQYGAHIKEVLITVDKNSYKGNEVITKEITINGDVEILIKVTDSRDKTTILKRMIKVEYYSPPKIINFSADRISSDERVVNLTYNFKMSSIANKNVCSWKIERRPKGSSNWSIVTKGDDKTLNEKTLTYNVLTDIEYEFRLFISDFNTSNEMSIVVYTVFVIFDFHKDGKGIAIGRSSTINNLFDINLPTNFKKEVKFEKSLNYKKNWNLVKLYNTTKAYSAGNALKYFKDLSGVVHLQGIVKDTSNSYIGKIDNQDCKPEKDLIIVAPCTGYKFAFLKIKTNGDIFIDNRNDIYTNWISLDGISFIAKS